MLPPNKDSSIFLSPLCWAAVIGPLLAFATGASAADGFRALGPGVLTVVPPDRSVDDVSQRFDLHELAQGRGEAWDPNHAPTHETLIGMAQNRQFLRDIWCLEFAYKPPRTIEIEVPGEGFTSRRERVWYLVYRVRNLQPQEAEGQPPQPGSGRRIVFPKDDKGREDLTSPQTEPVNLPVTFEPQFIFETHEALARAEGLLEHRDFLDRLVPSALEPISRREKIPLEQLHDSVSISERPIQAGEERWGVAVWEGIDPRIDFFTIFAYGLTNSLKWRHDAELITDEEHAPKYERRQLECLRLDFYHPGDGIGDSGDEVQLAHAGMFEQLALGSRLLEAASRAELTRAEHIQGVRQLGVQWQDFLEPEEKGEAWQGGAGLAPVELFATTLAKVEDPAERETLVRAFLGEQAIGWMEELVRAVAGPVSPEADARRRAALAEIELTPEEILEAPLVGFATIIRKLEQAPDMPTRQTEAAQFFGSAARRVDDIAHEVAIARTAALLRLLGVDEVALQQVSVRRALEFILPNLTTAENPAEDDPGRVVPRDEAELQLLLRGLFGHEGPELFERAEQATESEDYRWLFRETRRKDIL